MRQPPDGVSGSRYAALTWCSYEVTCGSGGGGIVKPEGYWLSQDVWGRKDEEEMRWGMMIFLLMLPLALVFALLLLVVM